MLTPPATARVIDVGDGTLPVAVAGDGIEALLLHGWTLDHRSWVPQLPLADRLRLVMPDRRGFGGATAPANLASEWQDIDRLVGSDRFVLVGMSQGAAVALDYAWRRPERLAGLVVIGAPLHDVVPHDSEEDALLRSYYSTMVAEGQLEAMKAEWRQHPLTRISSAARPLLEAMLDAYDGRDLRAAQQPIAITEADIATLPIPVLAIAGADDMPWRRHVAEFIGATAPKGRTVVIEGAGHLCNLDQPAGFNTLLFDFIHSLPR